MNKFLIGTAAVSLVVLSMGAWDLAHGQNAYWCYGGLGAGRQCDPYHPVIKNWYYQRYEDGRYRNKAEYASRRDCNRDVYSGYIASPHGGRCYPQY